MPEVSSNAAAPKGPDSEDSPGVKYLDDRTLVVESCNSTWLFDPTRLRFRRILKGLDLDVQHASTEWRPYYGLELDESSESFVVLLNPEGTRLLRSWRHVESCPQCDGQATEELSLEALRAAALG